MLQDCSSVEISLTSNLTFFASSQLFCVSVSVSAIGGLYMLGNYGAEGDFSKGESEFLAVLIAVSVGSLMATMVWKAISIKSDTQRGLAYLETVKPMSSRAVCVQKERLEKGSDFWITVSIVLTTSQSSLCIFR